MKKLLALVFVVLLAMTGAALAADFDFDKVEVDGEDAELEIEAPLVVERGDSVDISVWLKASEDVDDIEVYAWIRGDDGKIETETVETNDLRKGQRSKEIELTLELPDDLEIKNEDEYYTLHIEAENADAEIEWELTTIELDVRAIKHKLEVKKVINLPTNVKAGETLEPIVLVENTGASKEEDIDLTVSICDAENVCIASTGDILKDLSKGEDDESRDGMKLKVPVDAKTGDYDVVVEVTSDDTKVVAKYPLHVKGIAALGDDVEAIISLDTSVKQLAQGEEVAYKVTYANLGKEAVTYSVSVDGAGWATVRIEPLTVNVEPAKAAEVFAYLKANDNAPIGAHAFTLKVNANGETVKEMTLSAEVVEAESYNWESAKKGLEVGFAVLVVILIILGLVVAFRRGKSKEADATEEAYY